MRGILILLSFSLFLFGYIGKITALKGEAFILRDNDSLKAYLGMKIENKDKIKTKNARLQVIFKDNTIITIGKNSLFNIENFSFEKNKKPTEHFKLSQGIVKTITGKISKIAPNRFKLKTKNALIGIRGTIFIVEVQKDITKLSMLEGLTTFTDLTTAKTIEVKSGQQVILNPKLPKRIIIKKNFKLPILTVKKKSNKKSDITTNSNNKQAKTTVQKVAIQTKKTQTTQPIQPTTPIAENTDIPDTTTTIQNVDDITNEVTQNDNTNDINTLAKNTQNDIANNDNLNTNNNDNLNTNNNDNLNTNNNDLTRVVVSQTSDYKIGYTKDTNDIPTDTWVETSLNYTNSSEIDTLIANHTVANYIGPIVAISNNKELEGSTNIDIDFIYQQWSGSFYFGETTAQTRWAFDAGGSITNTGFTGQVGNTFSESNAHNIQGTISGKFYNTDATTIIGSGDLTSDESDASFDFVAERFEYSDDVTVIEKSNYTLGYARKVTSSSTQFYPSWARTSLNYTSTSTIQDFIDNGATAEYTGDLVAVDTDNNIVQTGTINLSFDFGQEKVTSEIEFGSNTDKWHFEMEGSVSTDSFNGTINDNTGNIKNDSAASDIKGSFTGHYYDIDAKTVTGTGNIQSSNKGSRAISFGADQTSLNYQ